MDEVLRMSAAQAVVAAMITPALLILASGSLVATALVRLARVVDRSRTIMTTIEAGPVADPTGIHKSLDRHRRRALYAERSVGLFFIAVVIFVFDCLSIGVDHFLGDNVTWLPVAATIAGMLVLIAGASYMVVETHLGTQQIVEEIDQGRRQMELRQSDGTPLRVAVP
jgi:Protein of unknown function (DUF2721)